MKKAFGDVGPAGGHKSMARAEIPLSAIQDQLDLKDDRAVQKWVIHRMEKGAPKKSTLKPSGGSRARGAATLSEEQGEPCAYPEKS